MPVSSSPRLALALLALVTLTGMLPQLASSRGHVVGVTTDGAPLEDHELLMMEKFHGWMAQHGRSYATTEEKLRRFEIYRQNVQFIEAANRDGRLSYTLGENEFTDLTHEEFLATHTSRRRAPRPDLVTEEEEEMVITTRAGHVSEGALLLAADEVPGRVNWTARGMVTEVQNQEQCRACWAFAAVAAMESAYAIAEGVKPPPKLSEQELVDCDYYDSGCTGGTLHSAFNWVKRNEGISLRKDYPYVAIEHKACQKRQPYVKIKDYGYVKERSEEDLMVAVARQPIPVAFDATDKCFQYYRSGVYNGMCIKNGEYVGPCSSYNLNHDLTIVGYVGKGNDQDKYWIVKNSWGKGWGRQGYVLLKKDVANPEGLCGIVRISPYYPVV